MKRFIKAATGNTILEDKYFKLVEDSGIGMHNTPWKGLEVITKDGPANKHVVSIRLNTKGWPEFDGDPVEYQYSDAYVSHGMRSNFDTLEDTREYIEVLEDAVEFAEEVNNYLESLN